MPAGQCSRAPAAPAAPAAPTPAAAAAPTAAADQVLHRYDNIIKSPEDKRLYRGLQLGNRMKVLLVSDPAAEKAAAALDVAVGYLSDPDHLPGLAHFCEHMLFLGTERFPHENEYARFLAEHGGSSNAATAADHTTFYFDVLPPHLPHALHIFSQFFVCPLFTESATERELCAVHSEHEKNRASDAWRLDQLNKATADPDHPYHKFGTGNRDTLDTEPRRRGVDVRAELLRFHEQWYSANLMALVVVGTEPLDELEALVGKLFAGVRDRDVRAPEWPRHPLPDERLPKRAFVEPVRDVRSLSVEWPVPEQRAHYRSAPAHHLAHLLGHEGPGSLLAALKARGWCNSLVAGLRAPARGFAFFGVQVDLTEEGARHTDDVVELLYGYVAMLRAAGPQRHLWEEQAALLALEFRFRDALEPRTLAQHYVHSLQEFPMEEVLSAQYTLSEWRGELVGALLELLRPERMRLALVGKQWAARCSQTEPWYGTRYLLEEVEGGQLARWAAAGALPELHLPPPNDYIPRRLQLEADRDATADAAAPVILKDTPFMRIWFKQDDEFKLPKAFVTLDFVSPVSYASPAACGLVALWAALLRDALQQQLYAAELASLRWSLANTRHGLALTVDGFDDKLPVLVERVVEALVRFRADPERFRVLKEAHLRALRNFDAEQPYQHAVYEQALCLSSEVWTRAELLRAAADLEPAALDDLVARALRSLHVEGLVAGNVSRARALALAERLHALLPADAAPLLPQQLLPAREVELEEGARFERAAEQRVHASSCASVYVSCGERAARANVVLELAAQALAEPAFHELRTRQQLGYIVFSGVRRGAGAHGLRVLVQSERHPRALERRIEAFLASMKQHLEDMSEEEFLKHRAALAAQRLERPKRLTSKASQLWAEITAQTYEFERARLEVEQLRTVTRQELLDYYMKHIHPSSSTRRKLSVHIVSVAEGGAGAAGAHAGEEAEEAGEEGAEGAEEAARPGRVVDLVEFRARRRLHALPAPALNIPRKGAHCKL